MNGIKIRPYGVDKLVEQTNKEIENIKNMAYFKKFQNIFMRNLYKKYTENEREFFDSFVGKREILKLTFSEICCLTNLINEREKLCEIILNKKFLNSVLETTKK